MRSFFVTVALALLAFANLSAGRLDVAVIQFPEDKTAGELNAAFASVSLTEITNSNRTMTSESYLKGGYVLFAQSLPASPGSSFALSTRIRDERADVEGRLGSGSISLTIALMEGVKAGLRNFEKKIYTGSGPLSAGAPQVVSLRQVKGKKPGGTKGDAKMESYQFTTAVVAQYTP